jgi:hypothetical protein
MEQDISSLSLGSTILLYIDTEFTDFTDCSLISIGVSASNGDSFYGENAGYEKTWSSDFVKTRVLPLLTGPMMKTPDLSARLWDWITELPCTSVVLTIDYSTDFELLLDLFGNELHPKVLAVQNLYAMIDEGAYFTAASRPIPKEDILSHASVLSADARYHFAGEFKDYFRRTGKIQHHALDDAIATRLALESTAKLFEVPGVSNVQS